MKIVIDIPEKMYTTICGRDEYKCNPLESYIKNGTLLPKGHGRIGDLDAVYDDICNSINAMTAIGITVDGEFLWSKLNDALDNAPTIIEADKESGNGTT